MFDDPIFLAKLGHFLAAFAARYDRQPWVRYVDIGSIGEWGEGHTSAGSQKEYGFAARKQHVDLLVCNCPGLMVIVAWLPAFRLPLGRKKPPEGAKQESGFSQSPWFSTHFSESLPPGAGQVRRSSSR